MCENRSIRLAHSCLNRNKADFLLHRGRFRLPLHKLTPWNSRPCSSDLLPRSRRGRGSRHRPDTSTHAPTAADCRACACRPSTSCCWRRNDPPPRPDRRASPPPAGRALVGNEFAFALPASQRLCGDAKELGGFVNADHLARHAKNIGYPNSVIDDRSNFPILDHPRQC